VWRERSLGRGRGRGGFEATAFALLRVAACAPPAEELLAAVITNRLDMSSTLWLGADCAWVLGTTWMMASVVEV